MSGKKEEYEYLDFAFEELATSYALLICPGNHDHDFESYRSNVVRNQMLKLESELHDKETIDITISGMNEYFQF